MRAPPDARRGRYGRGDHGENLWKRATKKRLTYFYVNRFLHRAEKGVRTHC